MRLAQFWNPGIATDIAANATNAPGSGSVRIGIVDDNDSITDITPSDGSIRTLNDLIALALRQQQSLADVAQRFRDDLDERGSSITAHKLRDLDITPALDRPHLLMPILAPEVWACEAVYELSVTQHAAYDPALGQLYDRAYRAPRPALFFKGNATRCVGPNAPIRIRRDSELTIAEPEIALVLDAAGNILAYTLANDVTALDIEHENPLYLTQAKMYQGSCALGPFLYTGDPLGRRDSNVVPAELQLFCRILTPDGQVFYQADSGLAQMSRSFDDLIAALITDNPIPTATVLLTGAGLLPGPEHALRPGQTVEISNPQIGTLRNPVEPAAPPASPRLSTAELPAQENG